ncbi:MAG: divalent-cation tolerance protein CutA [Planctomycetia bacterium]|nr:divalent-cation tolerance protein CutA [Planctomycetia bacterium]
MIEAIQIVTTFSNRTAGEEVGLELVRRGLVACAQVGGPIASMYRWHGQIETTEEWTLTLKTRRDRFDAVATAIRELHTYEMPEIVAFDIVATSAAYLQWIEENVGSAERIVGESA